MDISNLTSTYMEAAKLRTDNANLEKLKADYKDTSDGKTEDEKLMDACKKFESYFIEQMFKEMWKTVHTKEYSSNSMNTMSDYYKDEMIKEFADMSTNQGGYGLAQKLYDQMKRTGEAGSTVSAETAVKVAQAQKLSENSAIKVN